MLTRRRFAQLGAMTSASLALGRPAAQMTMPGASAPPIPPSASPADFTLDIAPYLLEASPKHRYPTIAYNGQVPGPLLRMKQGRQVTIDIHNHTADPEIVHWHGLFLPVETDGAMEEGSPMIAPGASTRISFTPDPAGFRWFHTHTFAGSDLRKGQYTGLHGFLLIDPAQPDPASATAAPYDREVFLALHDWGGREMPSADGSAMPDYEAATINGKMLGFGEPIRVKPAERVMMHILNSSPTEVHWLALAGHTFHVVALDGNPVPNPRDVSMLRLAPAERVSAIVTMNAPGVWVLGEVRKHVYAMGMGIVVEYANATGAPRWLQPPDLVWDYAQFAAQSSPPAAAAPIEIPLTFDSKFEGHGNAEIWRINGKSYPDVESPPLEAGKRYRLVMKNLSTDDHPIHLHRHTFEVTNVGGTSMRGLMKDVLLIPAQKTSEVEFTANHPGNTLFHCHQQDHMDRGFMMVFRYA
jgi:FtsP/CotA-like multicopper oxidase with cupredoxin domain